MQTTLSAPSTVLNLVFLDASVDDFHSLISGVTSNTEVIVLHPFEDGVTQITAALKGRRQISSLHIVSHGNPGSLRLGNTYLDLDSLEHYRSELQQWQGALSPDANILLYGCKVAAEAEGQAFVEELKRSIGVDIAASTTLTGSATQGGDWNLETTNGTAVALAFRSEVMAAYPSVLVDTFLSEDFSDASGTTPSPGWETVVLAGDPATDIWQFSNPGGRSIDPLLTDPFAIYDSDFLSNDDVAENIAFVSPTFDASGESSVFLKFDQEYQGLVDPDYGSRAFVEVYNGTEWQQVYFSESASPVIGPQAIDISGAAAGVTDAQVRFRYEGNWSYYWAIDNVEVVDELIPGVRTIGVPQVSEDNVPDPLSFQIVLEEQPSSDVTVSFGVDGTQLQPIAPLTFTPDNWNISQVAPVSAVSDDVYEGNEQTSQINLTVTSADGDYNGLTVAPVTAEITEDVIPGFPSYRTVEKTRSDLSTLAVNNPDIASWIDIGDSYDKVTPGGPEGYDLNVLELTNKSTNPVGGKPVLYVEAGIHAREYSTNEVVARFAETLVNGYGIDPDITWLLDYYQIDISAVTNPDGRKFAEQGYLWRKNTNPNPPPGEDPAPFPGYGVDLNRNHDFEWGEVPEGSSGNPNSEIYRGSAPASEPETQAVENFTRTLFPDQKGPNKTDAAPDDTTGVFLDIHSFGNTVLYPWGSTFDPSPNGEAQRELGLKFGYYTDANGTPYDVYQAIGLYPTDGTTDDWAYGVLGIAGYTWELGTDFFESSEYFEASIAPQVIPALLYAAKSARRPYQTPFGPETINVGVDLGQVVVGTNKDVVLTVTADDTRYADSNANGLEEGTELPPTQTIAGARYSIDNPSWIPGTRLYELAAADGSFDSSTETLTATVDTTGLTSGRHTLFVESQDADGNYGVPTAVFLDVLEAPKNPVGSAPKDPVVLEGTDSRDELFGGDSNEVIYGLGGNDFLRGKSGNDVILAGAGNDNVRGSMGDDILYGGAGDDTLKGSDGNDKVYGEAGDDFITGSTGDDLLWGGGGNDVLRGGEDADTFALTFNEGTDFVSDFEVGLDFVGLAGTLTFGQLTITQDHRDTVISYQDQTLLQIKSVAMSALTEATFVPVA